ncbi:MAG: penicillin-binding transpeptidase domain-containing protein [Bradymonadaceae bacterium]
MLEVGTNDVLAMATTPGFNPNNIGAYSPSDWRLRPVTDVLEPGSVFKPFVLAGALEEGTVNLGTTFDCEEGYYRVGGYGIHDTHAHDVLTAAEIIQKSSNIGIYKIARTLGKERLYEYLRGFGFGRRTGIGLPGERPGRLRPPSDWSEIGFANIAFGQGVSATPLQVAAGLSAIANDGLLMQPQVVEEVRNHRGEVVRSSEPTMRRRVVSEQTADKVTSAMAKVMTEEGTGTRAMLSGFKGAGKTGTAQQIDPKTGGYGEDNWVGSFGGFAPASSPEIVVLVMIDEPAKTHYGGVVAAPAFETIAQKALAIRGVEAGQPVEADDEEKKDTGGDDGARAGTANLLSASTSRETTSSVVLPDDGSSEKEQPSSVPDFEGMSLGAAVRKAARLGVLPRVRGWGRVVDQSPAAGEPLRQADELTLVLAPARRSGGEMEGRVQTGRSAPGGH